MNDDGHGRTHGFDTLQVHAGARPDPATGARQTPIYQTTAYVFRDADHAAALFNLQEVGFIYSRLTNPTVAVLQERIATLEGGVGGVCCSSGHAAQIMALFPLMAPGRNVVVSTRLYGGTVTQFTQTIKRFGWSARFVDFDDEEAVRAAIDDDTRAIFCESIANPGGYITDLPAIAAIADAAGIPLIVDNTSATPWLCRPIEHGATLVVHSTTKYLTGNGTVTGGAIVDFGPVRLVRVGQVPVAVGAGTGLSRPEVPRDVRPARLHLPRHRHRAARPRHDDEPAGGALHAHGDRDAQPPHGAARRERREGGALAGSRRAGDEGDLCRTRVPRPTTTGWRRSAPVAQARSSRLA